MAVASSVVVLVFRAVWAVIVVALAMGRDVDATAARPPNVAGYSADSSDGPGTSTRASTTTTTTTTTTTSRAATTPPEGEGSTIPSKTAIVVGAGPAGLVSSLGLASIDGIGRVHVLEKHAYETAPRGGTIGIAPNGARALREVCSDLWADLETIGMKLPPHMGGGGLLMPWFDMRMAMARAAERHPRIEVHMGESIASIEDDPGDDGVRVTCESGKELRGDLLVAADGVHSTVRSWLGLPPGLESESVVFRGCAIVDAGASSELQSLLHNGPAPMGQRQLRGAYFLAFNFHSLHHGLIVWVVSTTLDVDERSNPLSILVEAGLAEEEVPLFRELFARSPPDSQVPTPRGRIMQFDDATLAQYPAGGWGGRGCVTLVGDAAHGMRPTDGQGGNQAFEDAAVLARTVRAALASGSTPGEGAPTVSAALRSFESERLPRVKRIYESQQDRYERRMRGEPVGPLSPEFQAWLHNGV